MKILVRLFIRQLFFVLLMALSLEVVHERLELEVEVDAEEGTGGNEQHAENGDDRWVNLTARRHEHSEHDERHAENDKQECKYRLHGDLAAK